MQIPRYHILLAENDTGFRAHLKKIIRMIATDNSCFSVIITEAGNTDELEKEFNTHTDMAFIDSAFFKKERKYLSRIWKKANPACMVGLLLSGQDPAALEEAITGIQQQKNLPLNIHILKNSYPDELIRKVITRMMYLRDLRKNIAVA